MDAQEGTRLSPGHTELPYLDSGAAGECRGMQVKDVLARVGDKWSLCVVGALYGGPMRFNGLKRRVGGISQRMLTLTLRGLERDGLVTRAVYPTNPPSVEYALTDMGKTLVAPVLALVQWSEAHLSEIEHARNSFDAPSRPPS